MFVMMWRDSHFVWDPAAYGNITTVYLLRDEMWFPDVGTTQRISTIPMIENQYVRTRVNHDGLVVLVQQETATFKCPLNGNRFPFDVQTCTLIYRSQEYGHDYLNVSVFRPVYDDRLDPYRNHTGGTVA